MIIVGLGNPDRNYLKTYHNVGFICIDKFAEKLNVRFSKSECLSKTATYYLRDEKIILAKPQTYMNLSGEAVKQLLGKYGKDQIAVVISDDIDLDVGSIRMRRKGSGGTHNGLKNIVENVGQDFIRIRVGIGRDENIPLMNFVLSRIPDDVAEVLDKCAEKIADCLYDFVSTENTDKLERELNSFKVQ